MTLVEWGGEPPRKAMKNENKNETKIEGVEWAHGVGCVELMVNFFLKRKEAARKPNNEDQSESKKHPINRT